MSAPFTSSPEYVLPVTMDVTPELREVALSAAIADAEALASRPDWAAATTDRLLVNPPGLKPQPILESDTATVAS